MQSSTRSKLQHGPNKKGRYRTGYNPRSLFGALNGLPIRPIEKLFITIWAIGMIILLVGGITLALTNEAEASQIPSNAYKFRSYLIREARFEFGMEAPVPLFAGQIHQESAWRPDVSSPFADGLTQFTPDTAEWIAERYPDLGRADAFNPKWAIRAMLRYNKHLYNLFDEVDSDCHRWAFVLSSYNGGYGWIRRDRRLAVSNGKDPNLWWDNVERYSPRADWAFEENRDYPRKIIYIRQEYYIEEAVKWPGAKICRQEDSERSNESVTETRAPIEAVALRRDQIPMKGAQNSPGKIQEMISELVSSVNDMVGDRSE